AGAGMDQRRPGAGRQARAAGRRSTRRGHGQLTGPGHGRAPALEPGDRGLPDPGGGRDLMPRVGVLTFPGSLDDRDALRAVELMGGEGVALWHGDADLHGVAAVILPGGFSYGDYLRCGAIARFAPAMREVTAFAERGGPVLGICNGFQILCEAG